MKYCLVLCLSYSIKIPFTYQTEEVISLGDLVFIEIKNKKVWGIVIDFVKKPVSFVAKSILSIMTLDKNYHDFIHKIAEYYIVDYALVYKKVIMQLLYQTKKINQSALGLKKEVMVLLLSQEQTTAYNLIQSFFSLPELKPCVLHGITGSGKTYISIALIKFYLAKNQSIIYLFPNANLAHAILDEVKKYIDQAICFEYHSHGLKSDRNMVWQNIIEKKAMVIFGVYLPIFLPLMNIGIIIVDEEHDTGYADSRYPFFNIKEIALIKAQKEHIPILLASATPSINSYAQTLEKKYHYVKMNFRHFKAQLPDIKLIVMDKKEKKNIVSMALKDEIIQVLEHNEQVLLFFNKKGLFRYAECSDCEYKFTCKYCSILLTIYDHHVAQCNRCKYKINVPDVCPFCSKKKSICFVGYGLNKITNVIQLQFPKARIISIDGDLFKNKIQAEKIISDINDNQYDIIIGTQLITKGYNFHRVSLVGVLQADQQLNIPNYVTMEETVQQLIQVSGRAGRKDTAGKVIIQSYSDISYLKEFLDEDNYLNFVNFELSFRQKLLLPPYYKIAMILIKTKYVALGISISKKIHQHLLDNFLSSKDIHDIIVMLPEKSFLHKIKSYYYYQITIKSKQYSALKEIISEIIKKYNTKDIAVYFIPNPLLSSYE
jgi:primosomal protein N' (replication factor Y)